MVLDFHLTGTEDRTSMVPFFPSLSQLMVDEIQVTVRTLRFLPTFVAFVPEG